ncbi:monofunctional biosynthetic peptidoglycan transglycosylase [Dyadobacter sediminis]|uniref:Biosynthetic peptidoglycan transglycosylase n=1 Tax=Dyadobacter sediminis TaxID=1493691 RepID=A0A5R9KII7_9BACT|nr:monofunctional biosynthetic peptidoglycan transglycosylase [Dyadobacter sediminis]TLU95994.1 monofunctional biosynthetic peptidoglycan transglycosylase [Dyadobacter sediminis]GGB78363.1 monofunctional biosynthetic peptidoglycan transglycosylase [Dyadobacter sediminis]
MLFRLQFIALRILILFFGISIVWVLILKFLPVWITPYMLSCKFNAFKEDEDTEIHQDWEPYENISKEVALAVVASEDQNFPKHWGFDFDQIYNAVTEKRKRARGASTISQQVAKNVFLWHGRSLIRKGLEAYFTILIEVIWDKERILEVYLNVAEMGKMTFGVEAASLRYYKKSAKKLSRYEAARIAAVLPNPIRFSIKNPSSYVNKRTGQIVRQMRALGGQKYIADL